MKFSSDNFYHVYNRGNNREVIFFQERNYYFFAKKLGELIAPYCKVLAYCLMPNHYHLLLYFTEEPDRLITQTNLVSTMQVVERKIGTLQSSYTRAINNQEKRTGSLFQSGCKVKLLSPHHAFVCFHYIHQNPVRARLCLQFDEWRFSSFGEYFGSVDSGICSKELARELLEIPADRENFVAQCLGVGVDEEILKVLK